MSSSLFRGAVGEGLGTDIPLGALLKQIVVNHLRGAQPFFNVLLQEIPLPGMIPPYPGEATACTSCHTESSLASISLSGVRAFPPRLGRVQKSTGVEVYEALD